MIVLTILKVIGTVLLVILLLILLILGILLLVPIRYNGNGYKRESGEDYLFGFNAGWLLHFLKFEARYDPDGLNYSLKLLWKTILSSENDEADTDTEEQEELPSIKQDTKQGTENLDEVSEAKDVSDDEDSQQISDKSELKDNPEKDGTYSSHDMTSNGDISDIDNSEINLSVEELSENDPSEDIALNAHPSEASVKRDEITEEDKSDFSGSEIDESEIFLSDIEDSENADSDGPDSEKSSFFDKFKEKSDRILGKIGDIIRKIRDIKGAIDDEENREAVKLLINKTKYLFRHYRFRKFKGHFTYGSQDPSSVGNIMALLSLLYPLYGEDFLIEPVFDRDIMTGDMEFKGRLRLIHLLTALIQLLLNKKIRHFVLERI